MPATTDLTTRATELLHELAGPQAAFREDQLEAIADLVDDRARVLCVQRTGWGKSAVYFIATALLRERGAGPTLIVSPLLALMRNQIAAARRLGIRAHTVNSTNRDAWSEISALLDADEVDLLLISPERLNNPQFRAQMLPVFAKSVGLLVVDEAHCISDWGHDFRPDYRRIADMLERLPGNVGVLCTTATANDRVVADVEEQLRTGHQAAPLVVYRGPLGRTSLRFEVVELPGQADRLAWLATNLPQLPGSGIVYTLTKRDAEHVATWLTAHGIAAEAYTGEIETERRIAVEDRLLANDLKAVVATSALGMGYDKPDLGFVVHYQAPGSVISYYQQVGRAGRAIERAEVVLLRGAEDRRIQDFFIEQAFPRQELVDRVLAHLDAVGADGASTPELTAIVNLGRGRIDAMLKVLDVEGAVARDGSRWVRAADGDWAYDGERYAAITALRRREQATMASFGADGRCLMRALQEELDDPDPQDCGRCSVCAGPRYDGPLDPGLVREAIDHLRSQPLTLDTQEDGPERRGRDAQDPRRVRRRGGPRARAPRRRRLGSGAAARAARGAPRRRARRRRRAARALVAAARRLDRRGPVAAPSRRRRRPRAAPVGDARAALRRRCWSAPASARRSARWTTPSSRRPTSAARSASPRSRRRRAACCSTTCASAAGRWRWSAASCDSADRGRSSRSRSRRRSDRRHPLAIVRAMPSDTISFARGAPSLDIVDVDGLRDAATRAFTNDPGGATAYGTSIGYVPLRRWIAEQHGVDEAQVIVTNGSMQADAFLFATLVTPGDAVIVEKPTYDRTLLNLRGLGADVRMVDLQHDGIDTAQLREQLGFGINCEARPHHPELPEPGRLHAVARQAHGAARARQRVRVHDLRGRPLPPHPLQRRRPPDDARVRRERQRRLRLVVLEDRLPRHPRRLPRRPAAAHRADPEARDEHVHLAEHGRPGDRLRVLRVGRDRRRDRDGQERARRARRDARRRAAGAPAGGALHAARGRLLHVGRAARGHERRRAARTPRTSAGSRSSRARTSCSRAARTRCASPTPA